MAGSCATAHAHDLNRRGAFPHLVADAAVSLVAAVLAGAGMWCGLDLAGPATALLVAVVVAIGSFGLLRDAFNAAMDAVPRGIDQNQVRGWLLQQPGRFPVHHLHIWSLGAGEIAMTAHLVRAGDADLDAFIDRLNDGLDERFGINHRPCRSSAATARLRLRRPRAAWTGDRPAPWARARPRAWRRQFGHPNPRAPGRPETGTGSHIIRGYPGTRSIDAERHQKDAQARMGKSIESLRHNLVQGAHRPRQRRPGRQHQVNYYGSDMPLSQVASVAVGDARSIIITRGKNRWSARSEEAITRLRPRPDPTNTARHRDPPEHPGADRERRKELTKVVHHEGGTPRSRSATSAATPTTRSKELLKDKTDHRGRGRPAPRPRSRRSPTARSRTWTTW